MLAAHYYYALIYRLITMHNLKISRAKLHLSTAAWEIRDGVVDLPEQLRNAVVPVAC